MIGYNLWDFFFRFRTDSWPRVPTTKMASAKTTSSPQRNSSAALADIHGSIATGEAEKSPAGAQFVPVTLPSGPSGRPESLSSPFLARLRCLGEATAYEPAQQQHEHRPR